MQSKRDAFKDRYTAYFGAFPAENEHQAAIWWVFVDRVPPLHQEALFEAVRKSHTNSRAKPRLGAFRNEWACMDRALGGGGHPGMQWEMSLTPVERWMARCRYNSLVKIQKFRAGKCTIVDRYCEAANVETSHENASYICLALTMHESMGGCPPVKPGESIAAPIEEEWYWHCKEAGMWGAAVAEGLADTEPEAAPQHVSEVFVESEDVGYDDSKIPF